MNRIYGIRSDLWKRRELSSNEIAPLAASAGASKTEYYSAGPFSAGSVGEPALFFETERFILIGDGKIYQIEGQGQPDLRGFLAAELPRREFAQILAKLNGDFALALFDKQSKDVWLARDRFGVKPLYYASSGDAMAFGSLPAVVARLLGMKLEARAAYVARFIGTHYRYFDNDIEESPFQGVHQVAPGQCIRFVGNKVEKSQYWQLRQEPDHTLSERDLADAYRELLLDAVGVRLKASPARAYTLSGGMDSSSVLASSVKLLGQKQLAYSSVYSDKTYDESDEIQSMLDANVTEWRRAHIDVPDTFAIVDRMVRAHQEPVATATWLSHFILCEQSAKDGVRSLFGGLGGDELNAGEYEYFWHFFADLKVAGQTEQYGREVDAWARYHDHPVFKKSRAIADQNLPHYADLSNRGRCLPDRQRLSRYKESVLPGYYELSAFSPLMQTPFSSYLKNRCYQDLTLETIPPCLRAEDRQGAFFGLENILPFLDHRLVEFMFRVPGTQKFREGVTKHILREAMRGILPEETRTRIKKTGWNAPAHVWFSGKGGAMVADMVHSREFRERGIYNLPVIENILKEHETIVSQNQVRENHMMFLWQLVNLELWHRSIPSL